ncbi:hypothetical protein ACFFQW_28975 [Umezawaea endophytica]|uniref:Uncharacterized protein n=1 Tax=Umezawaea endophytica TaxID=1654476 RepID=A0A9X2VY53_9PSEU|nr:hypothetical protein [Umezawaea endophytica]MCS7484134.1 hypothetical protein [Umezawaea endophytica]
MSEHIDDPEFDRRLAEDLIALNADLDQVLDLDAGLVDATLPGRARIYAEDLDRVLDLDAGLAAILPTNPAPDTTARHDPDSEPVISHTREEAALLRFARTLASMPAVDRLHARLWLPRTALYTIRLLVRIGRSTREDLRVRAVDLVRLLAHDVAFDDGDALADALDHAHGLARGLKLALARVHTHFRDLAVDLDRDLSLALDRARVHTRDLDLDLALALDLVRDHDRDRVHDLARALKGARVHTRDLAVDLDRVLDLDYALDLALDLDHPPDKFSEHSVSQKKFEFVRAVEVDRAATDLREEDLLEAVGIMDRVVSDVVGADLGNADLTGIPLGGVRWSSTTRWPPTWQDLVYLNSVQIGHDLWEINQGGVDTDHLITMT